MNLRNEKSYRQPRLSTINTLKALPLFLASKIDCIEALSGYRIMGDPPYAYVRIDQARSVFS